MRRKLVDLGKRNGFTFVAVDLSGFRSGSLNQTLPDNLITLRAKKPS